MNPIETLRRERAMKCIGGARMMAMVAILAMMIISPVSAQEEKMSKDQWQSEMTTQTNRRTQVQAQLTQLNADIAKLRSQSSNMDVDLRACEDSLYALVGTNRAEVEAFEKELSDMENRVAELQRMSDAELMQHADEIDRMNMRLKEMAQSKVAKIPRYGDRVSALQDKVTALMKSVQKEKTYSVGTWSRNRDCLWNIAKKKDVYANAWMWPKIWQGNRDKIKDPDVIKPNWVLKIPEGKELSKEERSAANRYYRKKAAAPSGASQ